MTRASLILCTAFVLAACSIQAPVSAPPEDSPPTTHFMVEFHMPFDGCLLVRPISMTTDRYCDGDGWITFPDELQFCGETTIYYQNDNGKVVICAAPDCELSWEEQRTLYLWALGTEDEIGL